MKKKYQHLSTALFAIVKTRSFIMCVAVCLASNLCFANTFDVAADFSATNNPNGVWSYGWSSTLTSTLNLYSNHGKFDDTIPVDVWLGSNFSDTPSVAHNRTGRPITHRTITWQPGQFSLHPGESGEYSHVRWTAPDAGVSDIAAIFTGIDFNLGTTTDVHILHNGISLFDGLVNGLGNTSSFSITVTVGKGDIIDFAVGYGVNQSYYCDTTALSATISFIPEPAIEATVDMDPNTLNLGSKGQRVTVYITLPAGLASFNNHCYKVFSYPLSWEEANQACEKMGGSLACITTPEENNFILNLAGKTSFSEDSCLWIGGRKNPSTSAWEWVTGESLDMQDNLALEDRNEAYLNLRIKSGMWEDYPLEGEKVGQQGFVCEWSSLKLITKDMQFNPPIPVERGSLDLKEISIGKPFSELMFNDLNDTLINISNLKGKKGSFMLNAFAWRLATSPEAELRNGTKAIELATKACELTNWKDVTFVDTLAAAYAETGDFNSAVEWQKKAIDLLPGGEPPWRQPGYKDRLELYQSGKPYREKHARVQELPEQQQFEEYIGTAVSDVTLTDIEGKNIILSKLKGKRVILDFWATWCPPCKLEIPHFIKLANEVKSDNLVIIGISSDDKGALKDFIKKNGINYAVASADNLPSPFDKISSIPTTFFIDRNGIIQSVLSGYQDYDTLKANAVAENYKGEIKTAPIQPQTGLKDSEIKYTMEPQWTLNVPGAVSICAGNWGNDGKEKILVADRDRALHIIGVEGQIQSSITIPEVFGQIEIGKHKRHSCMLLGYSNWGSKVTVVDTNGMTLWEYQARTGVDGAHFGDLDGDNTDELIVGMNGDGGLHAVSCDGKQRWKNSEMGNVWNQAVVSGRDPKNTLVFATEAGGTIRVYDSNGQTVRTLKPLGKYYAQMTASLIDVNDDIQVVAIGDDDTVVAFNPTGQIAWTSSSLKKSSWRTSNFACGDMDGDGRKDWAFLEANGDLVIATSDGTKLAFLPAQKGIEGFSICSGLNGGALVTMSKGKIGSYSLSK